MMEAYIIPHCWKGVRDAATMFADPDAFRRDRLYFGIVACTLGCLCVSVVRSALREVLRVL